MIAISALTILLIVVVVAESVGFLIGYFVGRRSGAADRQVGFTVLPMPPGPDAEQSPPH